MKIVSNLQGAMVRIQSDLNMNKIVRHCQNIYVYGIVYHNFQCYARMITSIHIHAGECTKKIRNIKLL